MVRILILVLSLNFCSTASADVVYFRIKANVHDAKSYQTTIILNNAFKVDKDLTDTITYVEKLKENPSVIGESQGYTIKEPEDVFKDEVKIGTTEERYPGFSFQGRECYTFANGDKISYALIPPQAVLDKFKIFIQSIEPETTDLNPLSEHNLELLGIDQVIGYSREDVFKAYPEIKGLKKIGVDEKGNDILTDILFNSIWSGEE